MYGLLIDLLPWLYGFRLFSLDLEIVPAVDVLRRLWKMILGTDLHYLMIYKSEDWREWPDSWVFPNRNKEDWLWKVGFRG